MTIARIKNVKMTDDHTRLKTKEKVHSTNRKNRIKRHQKCKNDKRLYTFKNEKCKIKI